MKGTIDKFRRIHNGAKIAVLGSSPTLGLYKGEEDISIAVNGAVLFLDNSSKIDYFMCGDKESYKRRWFLSSKEFDATRIVSSFVLPYDKIIIPNPQERKTLQEKLNKFYEDGGHHIDFTLDNYILNSRHGFFYYSRPWNQKISRRQNKLSKSSTIAGVASQMAFIMGASEIHLYGCSFSDVDGKHYCYDPKEDHGEIKWWQPTTMDFTLSQIVRLGTKVYSHGPTNLRIPERIE